MKCGATASFDQACADAVLWRRQLHEHPELAFKEYQTSDFVAAKLTEFGLAVDRGLGGTGVVGTLHRGSGGPTIGIRADMDGLPIREANDFPHASKTPGIMHACGHDGHVSIALAAARVCSELDDLEGTVHFIFQPAEENEGGAREMVKEGLFDRFPCDSIYALHNWPGLELGYVGIRAGPIMGAMATFEVKLSGKACHAALPHEGADVVVAAGQLVTALQTVVSRNVDPAQTSVLSITQIHAGDAINACPGACVLRGTARWLDDVTGTLIERRIGELADTIARSFSCDASVTFQRCFPVTVNNADVAESLRNVVLHRVSGLAPIDVAPSLTAEDFAFMLEEVPGCYFWLGSGPAAAGSGLHSPRFDFNDEVIPFGVQIWVSLVSQSLAASSRAAEA